MKIWGLLSDTHKDKMKALPYIIKQFKERGVTQIFHMGDIEPEHIKPELFGGIPVICAVVDTQVGKEDYKEPPEGWQFTFPGKRIVDCDPKVYAGHKRPFEFLLKAEDDFNATLQELRHDADGLRWLFGGHTHFQTYKQGKLVNFVNPGAVEDSLNWGYEYAIVYPDLDQVVFSRILPVTPQEETFTIAVISDSLNVSRLDPMFWARLRDEFNQRAVRAIIHCGNISLNDVGRPELSEFEVFFNLRIDQLAGFKSAPDNWHKINNQSPIIDYRGYHFYVQLDLGLDFLKQSEYAMDKFSMEIRRKYPETSFVLCGFTNEALYVEGQQVRIINPGCVLPDHNFATICVPRFEITFGHVPVDPLPSLG
ncbi:MAG: metallophosphoesterase family protein [bacterium]